MSTLEKLFVQIFERKNWIIDQVKQQRDLYEQQLASKLPIGGIQHPSWLWNAGFENRSADLKELKKEELISSRLLPPSRPAIPSSSSHTIPSSSSYCTIYDKPVVTANNGELSDGLFMETCASNIYNDAGDRSAVEPKCHKIELFQGCTLNGVAELDPNATSPQDQTDERISDNYFEPCLSLARIQRSRSRQKALEFRHSVKPKSKKLQSNENSSRAYSGRITRSRTAFPRPNLVKELLESDNSSKIANKKHVGVSEETRNHPNKENDTMFYSGRITRSRSSCQQSNCSKEFSELDNSLCIVDEDGGRVAQSISAIRNPRSSGKLLPSTQPLSRIEGDADFQNAQGTEVTIRKSSSRQKDLEFCDWLEKNTEKNPSEGNISNEYVVKSARQQTTHQQLNCAYGLLNAYNSEILSGKVALSRSASPKKSSPLAKSSNRVEGHYLQKALSTQVNILPCHDVIDIVDQERYNAAIAEMELVPNGPFDACSIRSGSNMVGAVIREGLEFLVSRPPSDSSAFVEPKKLVFDDVEECGLNETVSPSLEKEKRNGSLEMKSFNSLESTETLQKVTACIDLRENCGSYLDEQLLQKQQGNEVASVEEEACGASFESQGKERPEPTEIEKSKRDSYTISSAGITSNLCAGSSRKGTSETFGDAVADTSLRRNIISEQVPSLINHLTTLQAGRESSIGSQLKNVVDFNLPDVDVDGQINNFGEKCSAEVDSEHGKLYLEEFRLETDACDCPKRSRNPDFNKVTGSSIFKEPAILLGARETEFSYAVSEVSTEVASNWQKVTADTAQIHNAERDVPYFLRSSTSHDNKFDCSKSSESRSRKKSIQLDKTYNNSYESSWPQYKRRKIEGRSANVFASSPRSRRDKPLQKNHKDKTFEYLKTIDNSGAVLEFQHFPVNLKVEVGQSNVINSPDVETHRSKKNHKMEGFGSSPKLEMEQGELNLEEKDQGANTSFKFNYTQVEASLVSSLIKETDRDSQGCLKEEVGIAYSTGVILDAKRQCSADDNQDLLCLESKLNVGSMEHFTFTEGTMHERKSYLGENDLFSYCSVMSPHNQGHNLIGDDQTMPEFEGFSIGIPTEKACTSIAVDGVSFDTSDLPSTTIERISVLEQLCRSASMLTPLPNFSTKHKLHTTPDLYQSLPNGLLEHMNLRNTLFPNDGDLEQLKVSYKCVSEEVDRTFLGRSYSDCMPSSSVRLGCHVRRPPYTPPVGKLCQRITSKSTGGSSEKLESINPELTCFRIEENPSTSEEHENLDEVADQFQVSISSREMNSSTIREPLVDTTTEYLNRPTLVSAAEKFIERGSLDSLNTEMNFPGTQSGVKQNLGNGYGSSRRYVNMENQVSSLGGNGVRKVTESLQNNFSKPNLSGKTGERKGGQSFLEKDSKRNNIVSNISSFIPLVQQKQQATAVLTGKRDIKVKALEAAEAARRLEEKKENERKMKKEAAKLERARLEQENIRLLKLKLKKKEEERKKKEADIAARKRLREEEERKEKERKRRCIEEARRQQREQEEKLRIEKEEKELRRQAADEKDHKRKVLMDETRKHQKTGKGRQRADFGKKTKVSNIHEDCEAFRESDDMEKVVSNSDKANGVGISVTEGNRDQSYEISPYQGSDREEEEDDIPKSKFIPSWARSLLLAPLSNAE
ncbi:hypothetical protein HHK36_002271 [Tetracentron sinense]|uniref:Inner centromere protein ARK-binding domain-containing protein n=1 Tax=Tetracentron sinense TaxID=13715 RepID=A0A834ZYR1_TETSI|nr:hypothetical protein HHK36_002271 [Tetracentron sinense]